MVAEEDIMDLARMKSRGCLPGALKALTDLNIPYGGQGIDLITARNLSPELIWAIYSAAGEDVNRFYELLNS